MTQVMPLNVSGHTSGRYNPGQQGLRVRAQGGPLPPQNASPLESIPDACSDSYGASSQRAIDPMSDGRIGHLVFL